MIILKLVEDFICRAPPHLIAVPPTLNVVTVSYGFVYACAALTVVSDFKSLQIV